MGLGSQQGFGEGKLLPKWPTRPALGRFGVALWPLLAALGLLLAALVRAQMCVNARAGVRNAPERHNKALQE